MRMAWGEYLLQTLLERGDAEPLVSGGAAPTGYVIPAGMPWGTLITEGLSRGHISLTN